MIERDRAQRRAVDSRPIRHVYAGFIMAHCTMRFRAKYRTALQKGYLTTDMMRMKGFTMTGLRAADSGCSTASTMSSAIEVSCTRRGFSKQRPPGASRLNIGQPLDDIEGRMCGQRKGYGRKRRGRGRWYAG